MASESARVRADGGGTVGAVGVDGAVGEDWLVSGTAATGTVTRSLRRVERIRIQRERFMGI